MSGNEHEKLKAWMADYVLHLQVAPDLPSHAIDGDLPDFSGEPHPEEGQIRLWPATDLQEAPLYGLLLQAGYGMWKVFPFSELAFPAMPSELSVRDEPPVRVIQGWNVRVIPHAKANRSWWVDSIPEEQLFLIHRWELILESGVEPSGDLLDFCGPSLRHPLDPRHEYMEMESCRVDSCLGESSADYLVDDELKKAAEPEADYGGESD